MKAKATKPKRQNLSNWFSSRWVFRIWLALTSIAVAGGTMLRLWRLDNPLIEPHPIRQSQTALTATLFAQGRTEFLNYKSPYEGTLWNFVHEFPLYQWLVSIPMRMGLGVEVSARLVTLVFFLVGLYFFARLARRFLDDKAIPWAVFAWLASPFCIIYSRTCLVDFPAVALMLASIELAFTAVTGVKHARKHPSFLILLLACAFGSLAAIMKTNVWFAPITAFCLYVLWCAHPVGAPSARSGERMQRSAAALLIGQAFFQLLVALIWIRYSMSLRGQSGAVLGEDTMAWIVGPLSIRFSPEAWGKIAMFLIRSMWHDWMIVPAVFAFFSPYRKTAFALLAIALFSILGTFNVHTYHDYYLIGEAPYLLAIVGIGLAFAFDSAFKSTKKLRKLDLLGDMRTVSYGVLALCCAIIATRVPRLGYLFSPLFYDYRQELVNMDRLRSLTSPDDLVFVESKTEQWEIPLYSQRDVILSPYYRSGKSFEPTVYRVKDGSILESVLAQDRDFWVDSTEDGFEVVRTLEKGSFIQDPSRHIWMGSSPDPRPARTTKIHGRVSLATCNTDGKWLEVDGDAYRGQVLVSVGEKVIHLPYRPYLFLPAKTAWGCQFDIAPELRSAASSNTEM